MATAHPEALQGINWKVMEEQGGALAQLKQVLRLTWPKAIALVLAAVSVIVVGRYAFQETRRVVAEPPALATLRLSASQFMLNWQSFPGRRAVIQFCTVTAAPDGQIACRVFVAGSETGRILIDARTVEPASAAWARATCQTQAATQACSVRLHGVIRKGEDGRPLIANAMLEP